MQQASPPRGTLVVSLDVTAVDSTETLRQIRNLAAILSAQQASATWCLPLGVDVAAVAEIVGRGHGSRAAGEIAWLADASWCGANVGRGAFATALANRLRAAAAADLSVSTLALRGVNCLPNMDVASRYGYFVLRGNPSHTRRGAAPAASRFGFWQLPVTVALSASRGTWWSSQVRAASAAIDRAIATGGVCHLHADVLRPETAATLDRLAQHVQVRRAENALRVESLTQFAARISQPRFAAQPARSILKVA
jgi:hypothetical protein